MASKIDEVLKKR